MLQLFDGHVLFVTVQQQVSLRPRRQQVAFRRLPGRNRIKLTFISR